MHVMNECYDKCVCVVYTPDKVLKAIATVSLTMVTCDCFLHSAVRVALWAVPGFRDVIQYTLAFVSTDS